MLTWVALLALVLFSGFTYRVARRKVSLAAGASAGLLMLMAALFGGRLEDALLRADPPQAVAQAAQVSQKTAFFHLDKLVDAGPSGETFTNPRDSRTQDYITGRFG